jgi:uncharacterized repeat protein (TIGR01451 family)
MKNYKRLAALGTTLGLGLAMLGLAGMSPAAHAATGGDVTLTKWVQAPLGAIGTGCSDSGAPVTAPCIGAVNPAGTFNYLLEVANTGSLPVAGYVIVDVLPSLGDSRGSAWTPRLYGPVTLDSATTSADPQATVLYGFSTSMCTPELNPGPADGAYQPGCDPGWFTEAQVVDWSIVKAIKLEGFQTTALEPGTKAVFSVPMVTDVNDPVDVVAFNGIAGRGSVPGTGAVAIRLGPTQSANVGVEIPASAAAVSVGDYVWADTNRDGQQDAGEPGIPGVTVQLYGSDGFIQQETVTDADGFYSFLGLTRGEPYRITFTAPAGMSFSQANTGSDSSDSDSIVSADGRTGSVAFRAPLSGFNQASDKSAGTLADDSTIDAGFVSAIVSPPVTQLYSIGDYVWFDTNRDGIQSAGEPAASGVTVNLFDAAGNQIATVTDSNGFYVFTGLTPGAAYHLQVVAPVGTGFTVPMQGPEGTQSVVGADGKTNFGSSGGTLTNSATVPDLPTLDAGLVKINLALTKALATAGPFTPGMTVTYTLTPQNTGLADALAGWSITDLLPTGMTLVSAVGTGYDCSASTAQTAYCTAAAPLPAGVSGEPLTVTVTLAATASSVLKNVAYVETVNGDVDETNPLVVPSMTTDTAASSTDNDAEATLTVMVTPVPTVTPTATPTPTVAPTATPVIAIPTVTTTPEATQATPVKSGVPTGIVGDPALNLAGLLAGLMFLATAAGIARRATRL